jgi:predicted nucleic acid-binding protein
MSDKVFFDTNIFGYAHDRHDPAKRDLAISLISQQAGTLVVSTQVMQEFFVVATAKLGIADLAAKQILRAWNRFEVVGVDHSRIEEAIDIKTLNRISFWDALIVAAAASANCKVLLTEDLNHGQTIAGVRVSNPFAVL